MLAGRRRQGQMSAAGPGWTPPLRLVGSSAGAGWHRAELAEAVAGGRPGFALAVRTRRPGDSASSRPQPQEDASSVSLFVLIFPSLLCFLLLPLCVFVPSCSYLVRPPTRHRPTTASAPMRRSPARHPSLSSARPPPRRPLSLEPQCREAEQPTMHPSGRPATLAPGPPSHHHPRHGLGIAA